VRLRQPRDSCSCWIYTQQNLHKNSEIHTGPPACGPSRRRRHRTNKASLQARRHSGELRTRRPSGGLGGAEAPLIHRPLSSFPFYYKWQRTRAVDYLAPGPSGPGGGPNMKAAEGRVSYVHSRNEGGETHHGSSAELEVRAGAAGISYFIRVLKKGKRTEVCPRVRGQP